MWSLVLTLNLRPVTTERGLIYKHTITMVQDITKSVTVTKYKDLTDDNIIFIANYAAKYFFKQLELEFCKDEWVLKNV